MGRGSYLAHKGLHPVRSNDTCMESALGLAFTHLAQEWPRWRTDHFLFADYGNLFPYFCNNAFLTRTEVYKEVIARPDLRLGEEEQLNRVIDDRGLPKCFISGSFG